MPDLCYSSVLSHQLPSNYEPNKFTYVLPELKLPLMSTTKKGLRCNPTSITFLSICIMSDQIVNESNLHSIRSFPYIVDIWLFREIEAIPSPRAKTIAPIFSPSKLVLVFHFQTVFWAEDLSLLYKKHTLYMARLNSFLTVELVARNRIVYVFEGPENKGD